MGSICFVFLMSAGLSGMNGDAMLLPGHAGVFPTACEAVTERN
ncbi:hypothetical protein SXCC_04825 [Gluconacetobacter sp. SXCC-1]|nr:hypothetical protein SXCC_04825 [Gluconacetobacter sp. SXCC-1]